MHNCIECNERCSCPSPNYIRCISCLDCAENAVEVTCVLCNRTLPLRESTTYEDKTLGCEYDVHFDCKYDPLKVREFEANVAYSVYGEN